MQVLVTSTIVAVGVLASVSAYLALRRLISAGAWRPSLAMVFSLWLCLYLVEYALFGPASFIAWDGEGNLAIAMDHYLAALHDGGRYTHSIGGGQDMYTWFVGMQYLHPELLLFHLLPTWLVILLHKAMVGTLGFFGSYLLAKKLAPASTMLAVAVAMLYPVSHDYLLTYSTEFGAGFAAIPLVVYLCVGRSRARTYWPQVFAGAVILSTAEPMKIFPAFLVAYVGVALLLPGVSLRRAGGAFLVCVVAAVLNWHEVLYALVITAPHLQRALGGEVVQAASVPNAIAETLRMSYNSWIASGLLVLAFGSLLRQRSPMVGRAGIAAAWALVSMTVAHAFPWELIGLPFLNRLSHQMYMVLALGTLMTPVAALAFDEPRPDRRGRWRPSLVIAAVALGVLAARTSHNLITLTHMGGQSLYTGIDALAKPDWPVDRTYRTATFAEMPPPNIVAGYYGFDIFDGQLNLNPTRWSDYWLAVVRGNRKHIVTTRLGWNWELWDGKSYDAERDIRFDLLAIANVRYLFSPLPLSSPSLKLLHAAPRERWGRVRPEFFDGLGAFLRYRLKRISDPGDVYVYELANALPRFFAASGLVSAAPDMAVPAYYDLVAATAPRLAAVVSQDDLHRLGQPHPLTVSGFAKVRDGFDITVEAPDGGVVVVNASHTPFWRAYADGRPLPVVPANGVHMAVAVPPGAALLTLRYERPLLREVIGVKMRRGN
ncbi:MAG: hypothetical protein HQL34_07035 [Alphaproteobacteria bacterium]|nr:hypothetical protein [Alphaproteobacteria bacterium]